MNAWVIDTCVLVAGLLSRRGATARLVDSVFSDALQPVYTPAILADYAEVLMRPELQIRPEERWAVLLKLRSSGRLVRPAPVSVRLPDPDDLPFVAAALATDERTVVTFNGRDFAPARALGVRVIEPREALLLG